MVYTPVASSDLFAAHPIGDNPAMNSTRSWIVITVSLLALGILSFALQPVLDPRPDTVCVADGTPSSGFVDGEKHCSVSTASSQRISDWDAKPKPFRIAGVVLLLAGVIVGVLGAVRSRRRAEASPTDRNATRT